MATLTIDIDLNNAQQCRAIAAMFEAMHPEVIETISAKEALTPKRIDKILTERATPSPLARIIPPSDPNPDEVIERIKAEERAQKEKYWQEHPGQDKRKPKKWAKKYNACIKCGRSDRKHMGKGLCSHCYFLQDEESELPQTPEARNEEVKIMGKHICDNPKCPYQPTDYREEDMIPWGDKKFCSDVCRDEYHHDIGEGATA